ncbi:GNAT family N-acetyltransferase [Bacillus wiedmannii]|uniref:GNAT family N-acetyltransferase n=1 Tax=Bacillus wiedmannii TaxID=1890302 RepID=UPI000BEF60B4|nr:GNAT family protein [Bacillus wiedmannii]PEO10424.1 GNAT family N-acetyltransferase [Bacillus wiedmannii]
MSFPVLETERLILREITKEDSKAIFDYFSRENVTQFYGMNSFKDLKEAETLVENFQSAFHDKRGIRWGIVTKTENEFIGTIGFHAWSPQHKRTEIGYEIHPDYWRKGYISEAVRTVITYGFNKWDLNRIGAIIFTDNIASHKSVQKFGFKQDGLLREYMYQNNHPNDVISYSLLKSEWNN